MTRARLLGWALSIGVLGLVAAALLHHALDAPGGAWFAALLLAGVFLASLLFALLAELPRWTGAAGGLFGAALVYAVLGVTIAAAPVGPGAARPGLRDLLWLPLLAGLGFAALCAGAGVLGVLAGKRLIKRR